MTDNTNVNKQQEIELSEVDATLEKRSLWLLSIARRWQAMKDDPDLADLSIFRLLNRLHARGISVNSEDVTEALALADSWKKTRANGLSKKTASEMIGITPEQLSEWLTAPQPGMPPLAEVGLTPGGKASYYDYIDVLALKAWYDKAKSS